MSAKRVGFRAHPSRTRVSIRRDGNGWIATVTMQIKCVAFDEKPAIATNAAIKSASYLSVEHPDIDPSGRICVAHPWKTDDR